LFSRFMIGVTLSMFAYGAVGLEQSVALSVNSLWPSLSVQEEMLSTADAGHDSMYSMVNTLVL
jgi:hypothetical protein